MSLSTARSPSSLGRNIPFVATEGFLTEHNLILVSQQAGPSTTFPLPLFLPVGLITAPGELLVEHKAPTPRGAPTNACSFAEHWNCPTSAVKPVARSTTSIITSTNKNDQDERSAPTIINTATAEDVYTEFATRWNFLEQSAERGDTTAARVQHGLQSILVCGCFGRPGGASTIPVLQVVACPTPTSDTTRGSPWNVTSEDQLPPVLDQRTSNDFSDIYLGSFRCSSRNRSHSALSKENIASYLDSAVFGYSTNGALFSSVLVEASHTEELDEALQKDKVLRSALYCTHEEGLQRLNGRGWNLLTDHQHHGSNDARHRKVAMLPTCIPLPVGSPLPPGVLAAANIGSENLIRAVRDQWGPTTSDFMSCNLIREWLDAVARDTEYFATSWYYVRDYLHLWDERAHFVNTAVENQFRRTTLRHTARLHLDALNYAEKKQNQTNIPRLIELCERVRDVLPSDPDDLQDECPSQFRFEASALLAPKSKTWSNLLAGFTLPQALIPPYLRAYKQVEVSARTDPMHIITEQLVHDNAHKATNSEESVSSSQESLAPLPPRPLNTLQNLMQLTLRKHPPPTSPAGRKGSRTAISANSAPPPPSRKREVAEITRSESHRQCRHISGDVVNNKDAATAAEVLLELRGRAAVLTEPICRPSLEQNQTLGAVSRRTTPEKSGFGLTLRFNEQFDIPNPCPRTLVPVIGRQGFWTWTINDGLPLDTETPNEFISESPPLNEGMASMHESERGQNTYGLTSWMDGKWMALIERRMGLELMLQLRLTNRLCHKINLLILEEQKGQHYLLAATSWINDVTLWIFCINNYPSEKRFKYRDDYLSYYEMIMKKMDPDNEEDRLTMGEMLVLADQIRNAKVC